MTREIVRILGIDTPEMRRLEHNLPYDQPFGPEAKAFAQGAFAAATRRRAAPLADARPLRPDARVSVHQRPQLLGAGHQGPV